MTKQAQETKGTKIQCTNMLLLAIVTVNKNKHMEMTHQVISD